MRKIPPTTVFIGQLPVFQPDTPGAEDGDFRNVPSSDLGDHGYADRGMLGSYRPTAEPFAAPEGVRFAAGYGASEDDLKRGYSEPSMREHAAYDLTNYKQRYTAPKAPDEDDNPATAGSEDLEFRRRSERSRGFFTRPNIPTDR